MIPLRAGKLPAYPGEPRFDAVRDGEIDRPSRMCSLTAARRISGMGLCLFRRSSNKLKSEVPPPISMTNACRS
jgi:hypothetical protein